MTARLDQAYVGICLTQGRYAVGLDSGDFELTGSTFTEDATFQTPAGTIWSGRDEIVANFSAGQKVRRANAIGIFQRHHVTTRHIVLDNAATATADSYFFVSTENGLDFSGTYKDMFALVGVDWLIRSRVITCDWIHPQSRFGSPAIRVRARGDYDSQE